MSDIVLCDTSAVLDVDRFIIEIEDRPMIWDVRYNDYSNKIAKTHAWEEICYIFVPGYTDMDLAAKNKAGMYFYYKYNKVHMRLRFYLRIEHH